MPSVEAETPRKMLPPPLSLHDALPISMTSFTSPAICCSVLGEMPYLPSPISASPLSLRRMRLNRGRFALGAVTGRGSYLARLRVVNKVQRARVADRLRSNVGEVTRELPLFSWRPPTTHPPEFAGREAALRLQPAARGARPRSKLAVEIGRASC